MPFPTPYTADQDRYDGRMPYRGCGRSGVKLPAISLGLWQNFGGNDVFETARAMLRRAFDRGVTHFDLANNYGPPYGSAEENFGRVLATDFASHRDELLISTKAGWDMWPGPYGDIGSSKKYLIASCEQSLRRMGLDYVDVFYSHRVDPTTPLEETMGALVQLHRQGKALYVGISSYEPGLTARAAAILAEEKVPLFIHQPSYSLLNRWIEKELLDTLGQLGTGCIAFSPLAQGMLTNKYLGGVPQDARAARGGSLSQGLLSEQNIATIRKLGDIARERGQSLAQMAIAWVLRDPRVTSALIGARTVEQLDDSLDAAKNLSFSDDELARIEAATAEGDINIWSGSSDITELPAAQGKPAAK
ncbi:L-glyceraldehyde 3-phosphate reductase [Sphingomonas aerophila]|jgi:L-glyceraldehyde 3-phosphate reductase|uniref:L-glyceraldehyde 3-phosphate reductase n=1 Tax=Sphingomonas aerophila TaxID=1344948 RepID=A0A7W9BDB8_9SPHN|nr:L-glyceraldehyde 3-phosphate reductase [Sphingomonas aerophila]MBB5714854.1 L-glyceraldehyde 3-phosphate reductase [Sphingomonas aerophila]